MNTRETARKRTELLKHLREAHRDTVARAQARLKTQQENRRKLAAAMAEAPKTVPEIAQASGLPADQVLWHITAMREYNLVVETGQQGEYYLYRPVKETKG
jgi:predicted Rossmann fold nucleotide-binding protein DprA/Smf involved in DNA uptake